MSEKLILQWFFDLLKHFHFPEAIRETISLNPDISKQIFQMVLKDYQYHFPEESEDLITRRIIRGETLGANYLYRISRFCFLHNILSEDHLYLLSSILLRVFGMEIFYSAEIGTGLRIQHSSGIVIGSKVKIGEGFRIYQNCTIGQDGKSDRRPVLGNNIILYANSLIIGGVNVADKTIIGANSVLFSSTTEGSIWSGNPAKEKP